MCTEHITQAAQQFAKCWLSHSGPMVAVHCWSKNAAFYAASGQWYAANLILDSCFMTLFLMPHEPCVAPYGEFRFA